MEYLDKIQEDVNSYELIVLCNRLVLCAQTLSEDNERTHFSKAHQ